MKLPVLIHCLLPLLLSGCGFGVTFSLGYKDMTASLKLDPPTRKTEINLPVQTVEVHPAK